MKRKDLRIALGYSAASKDSAVFRKLVEAQPKWFLVLGEKKQLQAYYDITLLKPDWKPAK